MKFQIEATSKLKRLALRTHLWLTNCYRELSALLFKRFDSPPDWHSLVRHGRTSSQKQIVCDRIWNDFKLKWFQWNPLRFSTWECQVTEIIESHKTRPKINQKKSKSLPTCLPMSPSHILTESGLVWDCSMSCSIRHWSLRWGSAVAFGRWRLVLGDSKTLADPVDWRRLSGNLFEWSGAPAVSTLQTLCGDLHLSGGATAQGKSPDFSDLVLMDSQTPGDPNCYL